MTRDLLSNRSKRCTELAEHILEKILCRRFWSAKDRDAIASAVDAFLSKEIFREKGRKGNA